ncbi:metal-dependent hydrolase [Glaciecola sp. MH2013]|uniref:metal-dependent hydrolase n=1 Tax=Glaciecola sp. MH2013 TaxID=2785524 RepID=UPI00189D7B33|nr:metal-dependent hydrolase [Glaciecola sp. MH2013]MBF7074270.1 metal-dependent hydrolase [Glaciecola sp. MH2013]
MDSLTQIALGGAVGYAVMGKQLGRKAVLYGAALGTLPDLDVFLPYGGEVQAFTYHRGFSHSFIVHLLLSPLFAWLFHHFYQGRYLFNDSGPTPKQNTAEYASQYSNKSMILRWSCFVFLTLSTHALIDSFTVYGTQLMWPLTEYPVGISNLFIIDPLYTLPLLITLGFVLFAKLPSKRTISVNLLGLVLSSLYVAWSLAAKVAIDNKIEIALKDKNIQASAYESTPAPLTTLLWRAVAVTDDAYYEIYASVFDSSEEVSFYAYPSKTSLLNSIENEWEVERLQWFTKGLYSVSQNGDDVVLSDLRMGAECFYVFNFNVGRIEEGKVELGDMQKTTKRPDPSALGRLWDRIWDPAVSLAPEQDCRKAD